MSPEQAVSRGFSVVASPYVVRGTALVSQVASWPLPSIVFIHPLDHIAITYPLGERLERAVGWIFGEARRKLRVAERELEEAMEVWT